MNLIANKVYLETFGCQMNVSDSERVASSLHARGYQIVESENEADIILLNTCSVREKAENKLYSRVGEIRKREFLNAHAPAHSASAAASVPAAAADFNSVNSDSVLNPVQPSAAAAHIDIGRQLLVGVMGCVAQLEGEALLAKPYKIDFVVGTAATGRVHTLIEQARQRAARATDKSSVNLLNSQVISHRTARKQPHNDRDAHTAVDLGARENDYEWAVSATHRQSPYVAFVPIIEGCNKFCTYCIVPFSRGRERSRPAQDIINQVNTLRLEGVREVHLIGQNVNSYRPGSITGLESVAGATPFVKLLRAVAQTGIERIKFTTSFPRDFHQDIVTALNEHENLCNWVHLPVQSGSDRVLKAMRRGHVVGSYLKHVEAIKNSARQLALTSDLIVGFPGETEQDFAATRRLVETCEFDSLYIFKYSQRPGTPAANLPDDVPAAEKQNRFLELDHLQKHLQTRIWRNYTGKTIAVLAEKQSVKNQTELSGHSTCHKVVNFSIASQAPSLGEIYQVEITEAKLNSLYGRERREGRGQTQTTSFQTQGEVF